MLTLLSTASPPSGGDQALTADNFESAINIANDFAAAGSVGAIQEKRRDFAVKQGRKAKDAKPEDIALVVRAKKAVTLIYQISERVPSLISQSHLERSEAWAAYWSPIFRALATQCVNPCREIRYRAVSALQRTLLSESVADTGHEHTEWTAIFDEVLFPLTLRLLKPEVYQLDSAGMNETRAQMGGLLCKVFLRYLDRLVEIRPFAEKEPEEEEDDDAEGTERPAPSEDKDRDEEEQVPASPKSASSTNQPKGTKMSDIYLKTLTLLDRLMNAGTIDPKSQSTDALAEAVREGVKNTLLVMDGAGYLNRHTENDRGKAGGEEIDIWTETVRRLERFLPGLVEELFPPAPEPELEVNEKGKGMESATTAAAPGDENRKPGSRPQTSEGEKK